VSSPSEQAVTDTATRLVEVAARLLDEEGEGAVTARRVTAEAGLSTMAVYTHFGSMDGLLAAIWREGFARFGAELDRPARTADPVADWMAQGWGYRHFGMREPHLYRVMFGDGLASLKIGGADDDEAALNTFVSLLTRLERCVAAGRFAIDDVFLAGEAVWAAVHGHTMIELTGYFERMARDPLAPYGECMLRMAIGFGDDPATAKASLARARSRAGRAGQLH
jgi:AcrR family transcriptional regulator